MSGRGIDREEGEGDGACLGNSKGSHHVPLLRSGMPDVAPCQGRLDHESEGVEDAAPNDGRLCVKGRFGYDFIYSQERLKTPLIRENGQFREASWDEALNLVAAKFKEIIAEHGPEAIGGVSCSRSINEDSYQMQKLFRSVIGTNNIDNCART